MICAIHQDALPFNKSLTCCQEAVTDLLTPEEVIDYAEADGQTQMIRRHLVELEAIDSDTARALASHFESQLPNDTETVQCVAQDASGQEAEQRVASINTGMKKSVRGLDERIDVIAALLQGANTTV